MTEHKKQISLFNSIEDILQYFKFRYREEEKDVHLMLFDPEDGCYHSYLTSSTEKATEEQVKEVIENHLKDYQYKDKLRKWINKNVRESDEKELALAVIQAAENNKKGEQYILPQVFSHETSLSKALQIILSSLPSYYRWDICGYYDRHYQQASYPFSIWRADSLAITDEYMLSGFSFLDKKTEKNETKLIANLEGLRKSCHFQKIIFQENYKSFHKNHIGSNYSLDEKGVYDGLYDKLRSVLYIGKFDRMIYAPVSLSQLYMGLIFIPFEYLKDGEEIDLKEFSKSASDFRLEKHRDFFPGLEKLWLTEFDKMMFEDISIYSSNDKIMEHFCYNINYIVKCEKCFLIKHDTGDGVESQTLWEWSDSDKSIFRVFKSTTNEIELEEIKKNVENLDDKNCGYKFFQDVYVVIHVEYQVEKDKYSIYLLTRDKETFKEEKNINLLKSIIQHRKQILYQILQNIGSSLFPQIKVIKKYGTKAAVSAIISRNHSHHIGSHVMPRTSVNKIEKKLKERIAKEISNNIRLNIIHRLKTRLDEYIQQKADFMAEIATEPLISAKTLSFFQETIIPFVTNTLLMDNLCANEGICYPENKVCGNRLKIFVTFNNTPLDATFSCGKCDENKLSEYPYHDACNTCNREIKFQGINGGDFDIVAPGPLGEYAFYSFLENFIRNAAKHNRKQFENNKNDNLEIHIEVSEIEKKDIKDKGNRNFFKKEDKDTFYKVEIWDNVTKPDKHIQKKRLVEFLNKKIKKPIIKKDGSLRREAWGIAEMKIMATLLKGSVNFLRLHENLLAKKNKKGNKFRLVYAFKIMKPKKVAVIFKTLPDRAKREEDERRGVLWLDSLENFIVHSQRGGSLASFEFAVIDKKLGVEFRNKKEDDKKEVLALLPFRVLIDGNNDVVPGAVEINDEFVKKLRTLSSEKILACVWEKWIGHVTKDKPYSMVIYLGRSENKSWARFAAEYNKKIVKNIALHILSENSQKLPSNDNDRFLMYDRHFDALDNNLNLKSKTVFHEIIDKNSSDFIHIFSHSNKEIFHGLIEASLLNVLIIDERVAEVADESIMGGDEASTADRFYGGRSRLRAFRHGKVFICTHVIKKGGDTIPLHLSIKDKYPRITIKLNKGKVPFISWKENKRKEGKDLPHPDIVIIHQGLMKDILKETDLSAFIDGLRKYIPYVAIVSGRGLTPDLPTTEKFVPFSLLAKWVMKERLSKYSLVRFLLPLKRRQAV